MINPDEVIKAFEKKFSAMSLWEKEQYLKDMGFSFEENKQSPQSTSKKQPFAYVRSNVKGSTDSVREEEFV